MKTRLAILALALALVAPAFATSDAALKGVYSFQVMAVSNEYGYFSGSNFVSVNGTCPKNEQCGNAAVEDVSVGTLQFNGNGTGKFLTIANTNSGSGGPTAGTVFTYAVSGYIANMALTIHGKKQTVALSLGAFNAAGVSTTVLIFVPNNDGSPTRPNIGVATLQ